MTENEAITMLHRAVVEIACIDNIHIRELFIMLFSKEMELDYRIFKACVDKELKRRIIDYKRRCGDA